MPHLLDVVVARNISGAELEIVDMGIGLADTLNTILTDRYELYDIRYSQDLWEAVSADKVVLNNGTDDLSKDEALAWFTAGAGGPATLGGDGRIPPGQIASGIRGFWISPGGDQTTFVSVGNASWTTTRYMIFEGTDQMGIPTSVDFMLQGTASTPAPGTDAFARLYDETNNQELAIANVTGDTGIVTVNVPAANWPTGPATIRLDLRRDGPGFVRCHSVKVYY